MHKHFASAGLRTLDAESLTNVGIPGWYDDNLHHNVRSGLSMMQAMIAWNMVRTPHERTNHKGATGYRPVWGPITRELPGKHGSV
eukprot:4402641-Pyramimonas_sp.AAC.1